MSRKRAASRPAEDALGLSASDDDGGAPAGRLGRRSPASLSELKDSTSRAVRARARRGTIPGSSAARKREAQRSGRGTQSEMTTPHYARHRAAC
jgi:hypothetical protein